MINFKKPIDQNILLRKLQTKAEEVGISRSGILERNLPLSSEAKTFLDFLSSLEQKGIMPPERIMALKQDVLIAQTNHLKPPSSGEDFLTWAKNFSTWVQNTVGPLANFDEGKTPPELRKIVIDTAAALVVGQKDFSINFFNELTESIKPEDNLVKELLGSMVEKHFENLSKQTDFIGLLTNGLLNNTVEVILKFNPQQALKFLQNILPQIQALPNDQKIKLFFQIEKNSPTGENDITKFLEEQRKIMSLNADEFPKLQESISQLSKKVTDQKERAENYVAAAKESANWINNPETQKNLQIFSALDEQAKSILQGYQAMEKFVAETTAYQKKLSDFEKKDMGTVKSLLEDPKKTLIEKTEAMNKLSSDHEKILSDYKPIYSSLSQSNRDAFPENSNGVPEFENGVSALFKQTSQMADNIQIDFKRTQADISETKTKRNEINTENMDLQQKIKTDKETHATLSHKIFTEKPEKDAKRAEKLKENATKLETLNVKLNKLNADKTEASQIFSNEGNLAKAIQDKLTHLRNENEKISKKQKRREGFYNLIDSRKTSKSGKTSRLFKIPFIKNFHTKYKDNEKTIKENQEKIDNLNGLDTQRKEFFTDSAFQDPKDSPQSSLRIFSQSLVLATEIETKPLTDRITNLITNLKNLKETQTEIMLLEAKTQGLTNEDLSEQAELKNLETSIAKLTGQLEESTKSAQEIENKLQKLEETEKQLQKLQGEFPKISIPKPANPPANPPKEALGSSLETPESGKPQPNVQKKQGQGRRVKATEGVIQNPEAIDGASTLPRFGFFKQPSTETKPSTIDPRAANQNNETPKPPGGGGLGGP